MKPPSKGYLPSDGALRCRALHKHRPRKHRPRKRHQRRHRPNLNRRVTLKLAVRQRVPQSEPSAGTLRRARSSEQAIAVARRGERNEKNQSDMGV